MANKTMNTNQISSDHLEKKFQNKVLVIFNLK